MSRIKGKLPPSESASNLKSGVGVGVGVCSSRALEWQKPGGPEYTHQERCENKFRMAGCVHTVVLIPYTEHGLDTLQAVDFITGHPETNPDSWPSGERQLKMKTSQGLKQPRRQNLTPMRTRPGVSSPGSCVSWTYHQSSCPFLCSTKPKRTENCHLSSSSRHSTPWCQLSKRLAQT